MLSSSLPQVRLKFASSSPLFASSPPQVPLSLPQVRLYLTQGSSQIYIESSSPSQKFASVLLTPASVLLKFASSLPQVCLKFASSLPPANYLWLSCCSTPTKMSISMPTNPMSSPMSNQAPSSMSILMSSPMLYLTPNQDLTVIAQRFSDLSTGNITPKISTGIWKRTKNFSGGLTTDQTPPPLRQCPANCLTQRPSQCPAKILSLRTPARDSTFDKEAPEGPSPKTMTVPPQENHGVQSHRAR